MWFRVTIFKPIVACISQTVQVTVIEQEAVHDLSSIWLRFGLMVGNALVLLYVVTLCQAPLVRDG